MSDVANLILIVDDSLTVRMDLSEAFEHKNMPCVSCATAAEARVILSNGTIGLVVLDVLLPDADGTDLLKEIRRMPTASHTPVLMLSSEGEVKDRVRGLRIGADEYVGKPYDTSYVVARAAELMRRNKPGTSVAAPRASVLVIDDSVTFREALRAALEEAGYEVLCANDGESGLRMAADHRPTAVIVDGMLPGLDGASVVRRIRLDAALRHMPCLLLTGSEDRDAELRALDAGADAFVRKEDHVEVVLARLTAAIRGSGALENAGVTASLLGPKKILAVDDSQTYLHALASALHGEGYDMVLAHSGEEALEMLAVQPVDCILLDLLMPGLGGQETCKRIKAAPFARDIPLIMLTALEDHNAMIEGLATGADDYISKSNDLAVLKARVRAQLRRKQFETETRRVREELLRRELDAAEARAARDLAETRAALVDELSRKNQELEAFSYSVSHDLRAPLRAIDGFSQALLDDHAAKLDSKGQDYLRRVRSAAQRMGELIDDMLQLSRLGRADITNDDVDLSAIAQDVLGDLQRQDGAREVTIVVQPDLHALGDKRLLRVALENLLGNAWKFTRKNEGPRIEVGARAQPSGLIYFVSDNGAGFDMRFSSKLFRPFQRLHADQEFTGTGIGLATVQRVISRHNGQIWAEAEVGKGATFCFTLAARRAPP